MPISNATKFAISSIRLAPWIKIYGKLQLILQDNKASAKLLSNLQIKQKCSLSTVNLPLHIQLLLSASQSKRHAFVKQPASIPGLTYDPRIRLVLSRRTKQSLNKTNENVAYIQQLVIADPIPAFSATLLWSGHKYTKPAYGNFLLQI